MTCFQFLDQILHSIFYTILLCFQYSLVSIVFIANVDSIVNFMALTNNTFIMCVLFFLSNLSVMLSFISFFLFFSLLFLGSIYVKS